MKRFLPVIVGAVAVIAVTIFGYSRLQADDAMGQAAILSAINAELVDTGWSAESIEITDRVEREHGDERMIAQGITATLRTTEPLYHGGRPVEGYVFLTETLPAGAVMELEAEAVVFIAPGLREENVHLMRPQALRSEGRTRAELQRDDVTLVIEGSDEGIAARAAIAEIAAAAEAARQAEIERLSAFYAGDWIAQTRCGTIDFEHRFTLEPGDEPLQYTGEVSYRAMHPTPPFETGSFALTGRYDTRVNRLELQHERWIEQPQGHFGASITLTPEAEDGAVLSGRSGSFLGRMTGGNCDYRMLRPEAHAAERDARLAPVRDLLALIETGRWIAGDQSGPAIDDRSDWPARVRINEVTGDYLFGTAELMGFSSRRREALDLFELNFAVFLTRGIDDMRIEFAPVRNRRVNGTNLRDLYRRANPCPAFTVSLDTVSGLLTAAQSERENCIQALNLPLLP